MATITTSITAETVYNPFEGVTAARRSNSAIPRAEVYAVVNEGSWPAPGAGNDRRLRIIHTLDTNYAYVVVGAHIKAISTNYVYADACAELNITASSSVYWSTALTTYKGWTAPSATVTAGGVEVRSMLNTGTAEEVRIMELRQPQNGMIFPFNDTNSIPSVNLSWYEITDNGTAYTIDYNLRLLQFDVDQAYNYLANTPNLIR
jgi:hypothetical protein